MTIKEFKVFMTYIVIVGFIVLGLYLDKTSRESITDKVQAICSFLSLGVSLVAIYYVFKTYKTQNDDAEFNRLLDITYRQLEYSNERWRMVDNLNIGQSLSALNRIYLRYKSYKYVSILDEVNRAEDIVRINNYLNVDLVELEKDLEIYYKLLSNSLAREQNALLVSIIHSNFLEKFEKIANYILKRLDVALENAANPNTGIAKLIAEKQISVEKLHQTKSILEKIKNFQNSI